MRELVIEIIISSETQVIVSHNKGDRAAQQSPDKALGWLACEGNRTNFDK